MHYKPDKTADKITVDGTEYTRRIFDKYCNQLVNRKYTFLTEVANALRITPGFEGTGPFLTKHLIHSDTDSSEQPRAVLDDDVIDDSNLGSKQGEQLGLFIPSVKATVFENGITLSGLECAMLFPIAPNFKRDQVPDGKSWQSWITQPGETMIDPCITAESKPDEKAFMALLLHSHEVFGGAGGYNVEGGLGELVQKHNSKYWDLTCSIKDGDSKHAVATYRYVDGSIFSPKKSDQDHLNSFCQLVLLSKISFLQQVLHVGIDLDSISEYL